MGGVEFVKGHGTENDFVLLPDPDGGLELTGARVRALCDRHRGLGADGVLRALPVALVGARLPGVDVAGSAAEWFMDYRNADGSVAEMCGNGVRVFARYLVEAGLAKPGEFAVGTRAGDRDVVVPAADPEGTVTVGMGPARVTGRSTAIVGGRVFPGVAVDVGNPHLVCGTADLADLDLTVAPDHHPAVFPHGVNVEFVHERSPGELWMRVHERGVGETRSCGTGTVAVAAATLHLAGRTEGAATVVVPGGRVVVTVDPAGTTLTGPAVLVARGELGAQWWSSVRD